MTQHFTRNTVSAAFYCSKCGKVTQHEVSIRKGACLECKERLEREHEAKKDAKPAEIQEGLFQ